MLINIYYNKIRPNKTGRILSMRGLVDGVGTKIQNIYSKAKTLHF